MIRPTEHHLEPRWRSQAHPGPRCFLSGLTWAMGDYRTLQINKETRNPEQNDKVKTINVWKPEMCWASLCGAVAEPGHWPPRWSSWERRDDQRCRHHRRPHLLSWIPHSGPETKPEKQIFALPQEKNLYATLTYFTTILQNFGDQTSRVKKMNLTKMRTLLSLKGLFIWDNLLVLPTNGKVGNEWI